MRSIKTQQDEIATLKDFSTLVESYEEIAAIRMRKVKKAVLSNRDYFEGLNDIYGFVQNAYSTYLSKLARKITVRNMSRKTNSKTVSIFLSSNTGLYGGIIGKTFDFFLEDIKNINTDIVIVGRYGKKLHAGLKIKQGYTYFDFSDSGVDEENFKNIFSYVIKYKYIVVYHSIFKNVLSQVPTKTNLTGYKEVDKTKDQSKYLAIFEPSVYEVTTFFETQILSVVFGQAINESSLSKFSSRMVSLDRAVAKTESNINRASLLLKKAKHTKLGRDQSSILSGISLWR